ncbi:hypothetical protein SSBR45G_06300 [Bradyrhizobium sp. SSBR45G]|uniref:tetratricopeptide repeat protein n=1 Tax=unclassified Bradyrhizobium TaxID=2631580 RepID=UPI002342B894|nr:MULTISPECIES: tetratricopeptide repeat protein [unclassified Bradyrhizobium]GLH75722.1 hypothetical protein SSBR45G_06300 [Bradyrhizobium sp. SSBR45G]GLH85712.1 hypothetical protein SSBR45R_31720 [Bradyrhizobium sp. SSBR45R]
MVLPAAGPAQKGTSQRETFVRQLATIERLTLQFFGMLLVLIFLYAMATAIHTWLLADFFHTTGMLLALSLAAAGAGGFLGFLFGIPRALQRSPPAPVTAPPQPANTGAGGGNADPNTDHSAVSARAAASSRLYGSNTNLEDISDWVTKIIVGLGLVQAGTIYSKMWNAAARFKEAMPGATGADVLFLLMCVAGGIGGFLFFYLETRTRIVLLFADAESVADAPDRSDAEAVIRVNEAPILNISPAEGAGARLPRVAPASKEDPKFLNITIDKLKDADQFAAWASAQARAGNLQAANTALQQAIALKPHDKDLLVKLAETQALQGRWSDAARALTEAEQDKKDDPELLRRDLFVSLYLRPPDSFNRAIQIAARLLALPSGMNDPRVYLWLAAAQGQRAAYYKERDHDEYDEAYADALNAVRKVVELEPDPAGSCRRALRGMLDPAREGTPAEDNDLEIFKGDPEFEKLILGSAPGRSETGPPP